MSHVMTSRARDNSRHSLQHHRAAEVRCIARWPPAMPVVLLVTFLVCAAVGRAQTPVTYETTPRDTLGETIWTIDLAGPMTASLDGSQFLVVNDADKMFYVVDVATGTYRKISSAPPVAHLTSYVVSNDFGLIAVATAYRNDQQKSVRRLEIIDLSADVSNQIAQALPIGYLAAISAVASRAVHGTALLDTQTGDTVTSFGLDYEARCWFDDAHGVLYRSLSNVVEEYDAVTGRFIRWHGSFGNAAATVARRAPGSPWLYVVTTRMDDSNPHRRHYPYVVAIHTETGEKRFFTAFAGDRQSALDPSLAYWIGMSKTVWFLVSMVMGINRYSPLVSMPKLHIAEHYLMLAFPPQDMQSGGCRM